MSRTALNGSPELVSGRSVGGGNKAVNTTEGVSTITTTVGLQLSSTASVSEVENTRWDIKITRYIVYLLSIKILLIELISLVYVLLLNALSFFPFSRSIFSTASSATGKNIASCVTTPKQKSGSKTAAPSIVHYKRRESTPPSSTYVTSSVQTPPNSSKLNIPAQGRLHQLPDVLFTLQLT